MIRFIVKHIFLLSLVSTQCKQLLCRTDGSLAVPAFHYAYRAEKRGAETNRCSQRHNPTSWNRGSGHSHAELGVLLLWQERRAGFGMLQSEISNKARSLYARGGRLQG